MKVIDKLDWNLLKDQKDNVIEILTKGITRLERKDSEHPLWGLVEFLADLIDEHDTGRDKESTSSQSRRSTMIPPTPRDIIIEEELQIIWDSAPPGPCEEKALFFFRKILRRKGFFVLKNHDELFEAAKRECNMISRDDVRQIASEELGMVDGPDEER